MFTQSVLAILAAAAQPASGCTDAIFHSVVASFMSGEPG
jgi:hypothetical protein